MTWVGHAFEIARRDYERAVLIPDDLPNALAKATSRAISIWSEAREQNNVKKFAPALSEILTLKREEAAALASGEDTYDSLLENFEPYLKSKDLDAIFRRLRERLVRLRDQVLGSSVEVPKTDFNFPKNAQLNLAKKLADTFRYDWNRGRLDLVVHPFSMGAGDDVRITTRVDESNPYDCLYSTIHEVGHAIYEQNISSDFQFTPMGRHVSIGVHESQSRICENQIGRSRAYCKWLFAQMRDSFGDFGIKDASSFFANANRVAKGYIRTVSDEVNYNLHIMLRYDLEKDLVRGKLEPDDLEEAWNARFLDDFGLSVDKPANGFLQDVHWSLGLFGYFPTYTLGNVYAGCLHEAMRTDLPDLDESLEDGNVNDATDWLRENVQKFGGLRKPRATIEFAARQPVSEEPLLNYLEAKFGEIYNL